MTHTLEHYLTSKHSRYMPQSVCEELENATKACTGGNDERLFWMLAGLNDYPSCDGCGVKLSSKTWVRFLKPEHRKFKGLKSGYRPFCGRSCAYKHGSKQQSYKDTCLQRYGVDHPMKHEDAINRRKATNIDKYGHSSTTRWTGAKFLELMKDGGLYEKIDTVGMLSSKVREMEVAFDVRCLSDLNQVDPLHNFELEWQHTCGRTWTSNITTRGIRACPSCWGGTSKGEQELAKFVLGLGVKLEQRTKNVIAPKELDLWLPDHQIAIEFDGTYWHSAKFESDKQCVEKLEQCKKLGIQLITVQEHLWVNRPELVKSRLASILGFTTRIGARSTKVSMIDSKTSRDFLDGNHLQGSARASVHVGMYHGDELVSVATFGKPRWAKNHDWELIRMASRSGITIQGGASKLMKFFRSQHSGSIVSYADRCWSLGNVYSQLGFKFNHNTAPSYWWVHHTLGTYSRYQTQKRKLDNLLTGIGKKFHQELSEDDNMRMAGFLPLYDRGNSVWLID